MKIEFNKNSAVRLIDWIIFIAISAFSLCYSIFWSSFAELNIQLPFLKFPIFVGEILLGVSMTLLVLKWVIEKKTLTKQHFLLFAFIAWFIVKALHGYVTFGPLAFRNAALFYYFLFAMISFSIFKKEFFNQVIIALLILAIFVINIKLTFHPYFTYPTLALCCVLILKLKKVWQRILAMVVLVAIYPFKNFFLVSKSFIVGNIFSFLFLAGFLIFVFWNINKKYKYALAFGFVLILALGFFKYAQKSHVSALTSPQKLVERIKQIDSFIEEREDTYDPRPLTVSLFDENKSDLSNVVHKRVSQTISREELLQRIAKAKDKRGVINVLKDFFDSKFVYILHEEKSIYNVYREHTHVFLKKQTQDIQKQNRQKKELDALMDELFINLEASFKEQRKKMWELAVSPLNAREDFRTQEVGEKAFKLLDNMQPLKEEPLKKTISYLGEKLTKRQDIVVETLHAYFKDYLREYKEKRGDLDLAVMKRDSVIFESDKYLKKVVGQSEGVGQEQGTFVFRFLIWRDMLRELIEEKAVLGINFGKPQRSKSLEILELAYASWMRDGWITPHNSFLNIIYRAGILGVGFVIGIFASFFSMVKKSVQLKSLEGLILSSIFLYWLTIANFSVVLELPYQAIPFWSLLGLSLAYLCRLQEDDAKNKPTKIKWFVE